MSLAPTIHRLLNIHLFTLDSNNHRILYTASESNTLTAGKPGKECFPNEYCKTIFYELLINDVEFLLSLFLNQGHRYSPVMFWRFQQFLKPFSMKASLFLCFQLLPERDLWFALMNSFPADVLFPWLTYILNYCSWACHSLISSLCHWSSFSLLRSMNWLST